MLWKGLESVPISLHLANKGNNFQLINDLAKNLRDAPGPSDDSSTVCEASSQMLSVEESLERNHRALGLLLSSLLLNFDYYF